MALLRDATQDCTAANASSTNLTASFPGGACVPGRLIIGIAQIPTTFSNASIKGGTGFTTAVSQDDFSSASVIGVAKISDGTETGVQFSHGAAAGQIRILGYQYTGVRAPLVVDQTGSTADDGSQHPNVTITLTGATTLADELVISAASLLGTGASPLSSNGTIIGNSGDGLYVAQRMVTTTSAFSDQISWTGNIFRTGIIFSIKAAPVFKSGTRLNQAVNRAATY